MVYRFVKRNSALFEILDPGLLCIMMQTVYWWGIMEIGDARVVFDDSVRAHHLQCTLIAICFEC